MSYTDYQYFGEAEYFTQKHHKRKVRETNAQVKVDNTENFMAELNAEMRHQLQARHEQRNKFQNQFVKQIKGDKQTEKSKKKFKQKVLQNNLRNHMVVRDTFLRIPSLVFNPKKKHYFQTLRMRNTLKKMSNITKNFDDKPDIFPQKYKTVDWLDQTANLRTDKRIYKSQQKETLADIKAYNYAQLQNTENTKTQFYQNPFKETGQKTQTSMSQKFSQTQGMPEKSAFKQAHSSRDMRKTLQVETKTKRLCSLSEDPKQKNQIHQAFSVKETSKQRLVRLKKEQIQKFSKKKRELIPKAKQYAKNHHFDTKKFTCGFSTGRRPRYNNSLIWLQKMRRDSYKIQLKRVKYLYPSKSVFKKNRQFNQIKKDWYKKIHTNKKRHDKLFYFGIKNGGVPYLYQRHSEQLYLKDQLKNYNYKDDKLKQEIVQKLRKDFEEFRQLCT